MENYVLKITTDHAIEIIEKPENEDYKWYAKQIGCDWIEVVHPRFFNCVLIVDEEGRLKTNKMNLIASAMYGTFDHGEPIVGDCLVVDEGLVDGENDIVGFSFERAMKIKNRIENSINKSTKFARFIRGI